MNLEASAQFFRNLIYHRKGFLIHNLLLINENVIFSHKLNYFI